MTVPRRFSFVAVVLAEPAQHRESRVAGLPAVSRILIEAARAGARAAYVVPVGPDNLTRTVRADLERAACPIEVHWLQAEAIQSALGSHAASDVIVLSRRAIVCADGLRRLTARAGAGVLFADGRAMAARLRGGATSLDDLDQIAARPGLARASAEAGEVIALERPAAATREVLRRTVKPTDGVVSRRINRPISRSLSAILLRWDGVRPAHMTAVTFATALAMFGALLLGGPAGIVAGGLLFQLASVVDGVDGEIARSTYRSSRLGAVMDTTVDMITNLLFVLGLTISLGRLQGPIYWAVGGAGFAVFLLGVICLSVMARRNPSAAGFDLLKVLYARSFTRGVWARSAVILKAIMSRDFFALAFAALTVVGLSWIIPWAFAAASTLWLVAIAAAPLLLRTSPAAAPREPAEADPAPAAVVQVLGRQRRSAATQAQRGAEPVHAADHKQPARRLEHAGGQPAAGC